MLLRFPEPPTDALEDWSLCTAETESRPTDSAATPTSSCAGLFPEPEAQGVAIHAVYAGEAPDEPLLAQLRHKLQDTLGWLHESQHPGAGRAAIWTRVIPTKFDELLVHRTRAVLPFPTGGRMGRALATLPPALTAQLIEYHSRIHLLRDAEEHAKAGRAVAACVRHEGILLVCFVPLTLGLESEHLVHFLAHLLAPRKPKSSGKVVFAPLCNGTQDACASAQVVWSQVLSRLDRAGVGPCCEWQWPTAPSVMSLDTFADSESMQVAYWLACAAAKPAADDSLYSPSSVVSHEADVQLTSSCPNQEPATPPSTPRRCEAIPRDGVDKLILAPNQADPFAVTALIGALAIFILSLLMAGWAVAQHRALSSRPTGPTYLTSPACRCECQAVDWSAWKLGMAHASHVMLKWRDAAAAHTTHLIISRGARAGNAFSLMRQWWACRRPHTLFGA